MNDTLPKEVHRQKALFSRDLPFKPQYGMMLYVEAGANEEINGYFHENMEKAVNILGESFTYLPAMLDKLAQIVEYNWPETDSAWIEKACFKKMSYLCRFKIYSSKKSNRKKHIKN